MFDIAIIGAGINGTASAHFLAKAGLDVAIFDKEAIAAGGSGAAGAFISPKVSKGGRLKEVIEAAYLYSLRFYDEDFPEHIVDSPQLHIAKHQDDAAKVMAFKTTTSIPLVKQPEARETLLSDYAKSFESVFIKESGVVDAQKMCEALAQDATFFQAEIKAITRTKRGWKVGDIEAEKVILATGAYDSVVDEPFIQLRAIWGHRVDIQTTTKIPFIIHHEVSIAPSSQTGASAIGATHDVHYHPQHTEHDYDIEAGRKTLLEKALGSVRLEEVEIVHDYTGLRSGSNDYLPLLGALPDASASLREHPELRKGAKVAPDALVYHPDLYIINGTGGYGFVLGPYLAYHLSRHIVDDRPIDPDLDPSRFLFRWAKRAGGLSQG